MKTPEEIKAEIKQINNKISSLYKKIQQEKDVLTKERSEIQKQCTHPNKERYEDMLGYYWEECVDCGLSFYND